MLFTRLHTCAPSAPRAQERTFFDPLTGMSWAPPDPFLCFADSGGDDGGGGSGGDKTFTQAEVDRIVTQRLAKESKKFADYDDLKTQAAKVPELAQKLEELNEQLALAGKNEEEKQKLLAEKLQGKLEAEKAELARERDEAKTAAEKAAESLRSTRIEYQLTAALSAGKALPGAIEKATRIFMQDANIEVDDNGRITGVTLDDIPYSDMKKATEAFLKSNPYFAAAPQGGGGTRGPNGGPTPKDWKELPPDEMARLAWNSAPTGTRQPDPDID